MLDAILPLAPVFASIALGYGLRMLDVVEDGLWAAIERLTWYVFLPALLLNSIAGADFNALPIDDAIVVVWLVIVIVIAMLLSMRRTMGFADPSFAAILQGSIRPNAYIALAASFALHGEDSLPAVAMAIVAFIPMVNLFSILAHTRFGKRRTRGAGHLVRDVLANPVIIACILGIVLNQAGVEIPRGVDTLLELLGRAALPLGLVTLGAALEFARIRGQASAIGAASVFKLAIVPASVLIGMNLARMEGVPADVVLLFAAAPASASCYMLSRDMGGDAELSSGIVTLHTLAALVSLPVWLYIRQWFI